jgi:hypothetical protein
VNAGACERTSHMESSSTPSEHPRPAVRPTSRSRFKRLSPATKYAAILVVVVVLLIIGQVMLHAMKTEPRDSRLIADRELRLNVLQPNERLDQTISVVQRSPMDYFRATHGILALTNKRIVYLGLRPRDMLAPADAPPTFDQRDFPLDTGVSVTQGRAMGYLTRGVIVKMPGETVRLGVPENSWPEAQKLVARMTTSRAEAHATAVQQDSLRKLADAEWKQAVAAWKKAQYYTVRTGDALGSVATQWNTTPDQLMKLNHLADNRIRVGQTLMVRDAID